MPPDTSAYPECDRLHEATKRTQPAGEFLEWLSERGIHLMEYGHWQDQESCFRCLGFGKLNAGDPCPSCGGLGAIAVDREGYLPVTKSREALLAEWQGIDLTKVEEERRTMLAKLAAGEPV